MNIDTLNTVHFGPFHHMTLQLNPGINVIYGENEAGKSTLHQFIKLMFFGAERLRGKAAKKDEYNRFMPWEGGTGYEGVLTFQHQGEEYRLIRNFYKENESFRVEQLSTGKSMELPGGTIDSIVEGLNRSNFQNVLSIGQLEAAVDARFGLTLQAYMANVNRTKSEDISLQKTFEFLKKEKKSKIESKAERQLQELKQQSEKLEVTRSEKELLLKTIDEQRNRLEDIQRQLKQQKSEDQADRMREQKERLEAVRLIEENNRIAEAYRGKKAEYESLKAKMETVNFDEMENELERLSDRYDRMKGRNIAIIFSMVMFELAMLVVVFILKNAWTARALAVGVLTVIVLLTAFALHSGRKRMRAKVQRKKEALGSQLFGGESREQLQLLQKDMQKLRQDYGDIQEPLKPYLEKYGENITLDVDMEASDRYLESLREQEADQMRSLERLYVQMEELEERENEWMELQDEMQLLDAEIQNGRDEAEIIDECMMMIQELSEAIHSDFGPALNQEMSKIMGELTEGKYNRVVADADLNLKVDMDSGFAEMQQLSVGTREQLYFALRMAMVKLIDPNKDMPVFFDDSFVYYDDRRLAHILSWLSRQNFPQVLIFTCQHREMECLDQMGIPYTKVLLSVDQ